MKLKLHVMAAVLLSLAAIRGKDFVQQREPAASA